MSLDRRFAAAWACWFGFLTALLAGTIVTAPEARLSTLVTLATMLVAGPAFYVVVRRRPTALGARSMLPRTVLYFLVVFVGGVVTTRLVWLMVGTTTFAALAGQLLAMAAVVAVGAWLSLQGGAEQVVESDTDLEL